MSLTLLAAMFAVQVAAGQDPARPVCSRHDAYARAVYGQALDRAPNSLDAMFDAARCYDHSWQWDEAARVLERALAALDALPRAAAAVPPPPVPPDAVAVAGVHVATPERTRNAQPPYPADAYLAGLSGFVILELAVDAKGNVTDAKAVRSIPGLDDSAIKAARKWKYKPTTINGNAVPVITFGGITFGAPGEPVPSDWIDFAQLHHTAGRHVLARASIVAALDRLREDQLRFLGLVDPYAHPKDPAFVFPVIKKQLNPKYPAEGFATRTEGFVDLECIVDTAGRPGRIRVITPPSVLDGAAVDALRQWEFEPSRPDGVARAVIVRVRMEFRLR
ncbi:MAG: hypothetical protein AMXMBFR57_00050 [Acidimicrobiia bacterium]|jgi:TonB family protein